MKLELAVVFFLDLILRWLDIPAALHNLLLERKFRIYLLESFKHVSVRFKIGWRLYHDKNLLFLKKLVHFLRANVPETYLQ